jgi:hypothetical protein
MIVKLGNACFLRIKQISNHKAATVLHLKNSQYLAASLALPLQMNTEEFHNHVAPERVIQHVQCQRKKAAIVGQQDTVELGFCRYHWQYSQSSHGPRIRRPLFELSTWVVNEPASGNPNLTKASRKDRFLHSQMQVVVLSKQGHKCCHRQINMHGNIRQGRCTICC